MASGALAISQIIRKFLEAPTPREIAKPTEDVPRNLSNENSESLFHARSRYFNKAPEIPIRRTIETQELDKPCETTHECTVRFGDEFACIHMDGPARLHFNMENVSKTIIFGGDSKSSATNIKNETKNCKRCVPIGKSRRAIKCNPLTSIAVCSAVYSSETNRFNVHWVCESLYPDMFTEDPETGDITKSHACGAAENRGRLIHEVSRLPWDKHYECYGLYDPIDSLKCECYPFPFKPEEVDTKKSLYARNILLLPATSTCVRSNCAPGRPHLSNPQACDCPAGYVSCPILSLLDYEEFHRCLCWGSYVRSLRNPPMPSCVRDPCMPHAKMDVASGKCVASDKEVTVVNDENIFPNVPWGVPIRRRHTLICGTDMEAPLKRKKYIKLD